LHFGQTGDAVATNGSRGLPSTLSFIRRHLFETIESADRSELDLDRDASGERRSQMPVPLTLIALPVFEIDHKGTFQ